MPISEMTATVTPEPPCPLCHAPAARLGPVYGKYLRRTFALHRCDACHFAFIADPSLDFDRIYTDAYYRGEGADPLVDYDGELNSARTIRRYEWRGLLTWAKSLTSVDRSTRWLDYGCGSGGFVSYLRAQGIDAWGFDQGRAVERLPESFPLLREADLAARSGSFDVVSAIEVIEHIPDPIAALRQIRRLMKPGGVLLLTTGNAEPFRKELTTWRYVIPEIHISIFEPKALALALERSGFEPIFTGFAPGWTDIITFKLLKNMRRRRSGRVADALPWPLLARIADRVYGLSAHPVGRAI